MRRKHIRELYLGGLRPADSHGFETKLYKQFSEEFDRIYDEIQSLIPKDKRKKIDKLCDAQTSMYGEVVIDAFVNGFKLGMNLAAEALYSEKK